MQRSGPKDRKMLKLGLPCYAFAKQFCFPERSVKVYKYKYPFEILQELQVLHGEIAEFRIETNGSRN